ncbi:Hypothetical predicted protein [Pelobates cultripes]|uniref:Uncharacterized protein n=1 Tax=Pelobates cultripes TaxID=61616 RepID=A0AAD1SPK8_PELCU|nr:Hypothetical predicted protein [Pelobates cultripes]
MRQEVTCLKETVQQLLTSHSTLITRVDLAEERNRCTKLKLRGIPDSINITELPHYLCRLTNMLLPHSQAKKILFDGFFRIKKPRQAPTTASQDVIIRCQSLTDKNRIIAAGRGKTPMTFESSQISYQNLTCNTLLWRRSMGPVTHQLHQAGIDYRWTIPRALTVNKEGTILRLSSLDKAERFLQALGIPPKSRQPATSLASPSWDPSSSGVEKRKGH